MIERGESHYDRILRLVENPTWLTTPPRELVEADRVGRWHEVVARVRREDRLRLTSLVQMRALRILQAVALESEARGHSVDIPTWRDDGRGFTQRVEAGQLGICVRKYRFAVGLSQREDYTAHEPTKEELHRQAQWSWSRPPRWDKTPGQRLRIRLYFGEHRSWSAEWNDGKTLSTRIEDHLPELMDRIERSANASDAREDAERVEQERQRNRRTRAEELVMDLHTDDVRARVLLGQLAEWTHVRSLEAYLDDMDRRLLASTSPSDRAAGDGWLAWCRDYVRDADPLNKPICMPKVVEPTWKERAILMERILGRSDL